MSFEADSERKIEAIESDTRHRTLGYCVQRGCNKELIEYLSQNGIWCYNYQLPDEYRIVYLMTPGRYCCRNCATQRQRNKHDRTF